MRGTRTRVCHAILGVIISATIVRGCEYVYLIWGMESESADPLFRFVRNGKAGYIDDSGKVVIPPRLPADDNSFGEFHEGLLRVREEKGFRYVDRSGARVFRTDAWLASDFSEGVAAAADGKVDSWGFIDRTGKYVISPRYSSVQDYSEGLALVSIDDVPGGVGYIDKRGEFVIPPTLSRGSSFHEGLAAVVSGGPCQAISTGCFSRPILRPMANLPTYDCMFTFVDKTGQPVSKLRFGDAGDFSEGLAAVRVDGAWGYVDHSFHVVIRPQFDSAEPFSDGMAQVRMRDKFGFIDHSGHFVVEPQFVAVSSFSNGRAAVSRLASSGGSLWRFIDKTGKPAFPGEFQLATSFHHGLAHVALNNKGKFAFIDTNGRAVFAYDAGTAPRRTQ